MTVVEVKSAPAHSPARAFLRDVEPFFHGRPVTYVDVGAHAGNTFREIWRSGLRPRRAYLIEPNPASFAQLTATVRELAAGTAAVCYNLALGAEPARLRLRAEDTMTHVVGPADGTPGPQHFDVEARRLDDLAADFAPRHVSLLKIDVEGHEAEVLAGAAGLLAEQAIDMIHVEVGFDPASPTLTYYRRIEDLLAGHGYRLFKIYEQKNEWLEDSPVLRRSNMTFMSRRFAESAPYRLSRDLFATRQHAAELEARLAERGREAEAAAKDRDAAKERLAERERTAEAQAGDIATLRASLVERDQALEELRGLLDAERRTRGAGEKAAAEREASMRDLERRLAERERAMEAAAAKEAELRERLTALEIYARSLEARHVAMLESETWRVMEPARRAIRLMTGKRPGVPFTPRFLDGPKTPPGGGPEKGKGAKLTAAAARKAGEDLIRRATKRDYVALVAEERRFSAAPQSDQNFFLGRFCKLIAMSSLSAYSEVARTADEITERLGRKQAWIVRFFGKSVYGRFVADAAMALTRVGRYEEARRLVDDAVGRLDRSPEILQLRAEVCWPYAPEQALEDIAESRRDGDLGGSHALLEAYLETIVANGPPPTDDRLAENPQMPLVAAIAALRRGDFETYRRRFNGYFVTQGLSAPLSESTTQFAFADLTSQAQARRNGPLVSVVMTTYNSVETVDYAVASLRGQTHGNLEIWIVDDGSTDGTRARLAALEATDDRVRVLLNEENVGTYCSKNRAIAQASGDYVTMHDSDDWAHPERIARHVELMEGARSVMASRSEWLRLEADGAPSFRRWGRRFQHPNPASAFYRRSVFDQVGFFDSVRFGADSEHWYRVRRVFGPGCSKSLPLCLGLGSIRADSLTRSGDGAMDRENYSPVRGAYAASYFYWHATADPAQLKLPPRVEVRPFPAPPEMATPAPGRAAEAAPDLPTPARAAGAGEPEFMFGISLVSARVASDWKRTQELLGHTLRSVLNQSDPRFGVAICGHERPDLPELADPRVQFVESDQAPPNGTLVGFRGDKMRKRRIIGAMLRARGGGYFFPLDADDLVHRDVVAYVRADDNRRGYLIEKGFALDYNNRVLAPIPGAWSVSFDRACGSSAAIWFAPEELPVDSENNPELYFNLFQSHAYWPIVAEEFGRRFDPLPLPGVYVVNHAQNLSFRLQRKGVRTENIVRAIAAHQVAEAQAILGENFGLSL
jgi:FkbM family methyltransferase